MKKILIILGVIVLLLGIGAYLFLVPAAPDKAVLYIESGTVEVNSGGGWQAASDEMMLKPGQSVRTAEGEASIVFLEGEIMHLQPNSEVTLESVSRTEINVMQNAGETWNKVTKLSGVHEFAVTTPNAVATVRGTQFFLNTSRLFVLDGKVNFGPKNEPFMLEVQQLKKATAEGWAVEDMTPEEIAKYKAFAQKYIAVLKRVREREIKKHATILSQAAKKGYDWNKITSELEKVDNDSKPSEDELFGKVPSLFKSQANRAYKLTKEIKKSLQQGVSNCLNPGKCRIWAGCVNTDKLLIDGKEVGQCVEGSDAASQGIGYCGHYTLQNGNKVCNYQDKSIQHLCVCP